MSSGSARSLTAILPPVPPLFPGVSSLFPRCSREQGTQKMFEMRRCASNWRGLAWTVCPAVSTHPPLFAGRAPRPGTTSTSGSRAPRPARPGAGAVAARCDRCRLSSTLPPARISRRCPRPRRVFDHRTRRKDHAGDIGRRPLCRVPCMGTTRSRHDTNAHAVCPASRDPLDERETPALNGPGVEYGE